MTQSIFQAQPFELPFDPRTTALVMIDMQRDFVEAGGFGEALGNDVSRVRTAIAPCTEVLAAARQKGIMVIHTREGHRADLSDCPPAKLTRGGKTFIGEPGPMGRILVRGEAGHDIIPEYTHRSAQRCLMQLLKCWKLYQGPPVPQRQCHRQPNHMAL